MCAIYMKESPNLIMAHSHTLHILKLWFKCLLMYISILLLGYYINKTLTYSVTHTEINTKQLNAKTDNSQEKAVDYAAIGIFNQHDPAEKIDTNSMKKDSQNIDDKRNINDDHLKLYHKSKQMRGEEADSTDIQNKSNGNAFQKCDLQCQQFIRYIQSERFKEKPKSAIHILTQVNRLQNLLGTLKNLEEMFNNWTQYPYIIFHEEDFIKVK